MSHPSDPRNANLESPMKLPPSWYVEPEAAASSAMFLSSAVLLTRNRYLAWVAFLIALGGYFNRQPLRTKDGGNNFASLAFATAALLLSYFSSMLIPDDPTDIPASVPLSF